MNSTSTNMFVTARKPSYGFMNEFTTQRLAEITNEINIGTDTTTVEKNETEVNSLLQNLNDKRDLFDCYQVFEY